jgi:tetratricopeptide (TPR) repeat protein
MTAESSGTAASERYARATAITHALLDLPLHERAARLERECADDTALRDEVTWMLRAAQSEDHDDEAPFVADAHELLNCDGAALAAVAPREYRILRPLGEGGTGMVYLAERSEDGLRQQVALKLLRFAATASGLRHFREEQRILAGLRHDNIAHFIDAGTLANGQPFLAVEYVDGTAIDRWCASQPLATRLAAFLEVCAAVSHAHAQLVIHRDIKPGNILVTAGGEPKLLDFGIARLIDAGDARTLTGARALTPAYASPEQIEGGVLGTATDVYSLGAVLYELVCAVRPFAEAKSELALSQAIVAGKVTAPSRVARVPTDIEAIILKAMRREPAQRYASVAELADDLRRFLASQPVQARRGSSAYRARRFVWRHRYALAVAIVAALVLSAFVAVTLVELRRTQAQRERADRINQFFNSVLAAGDPAEMGRGATVAEALERAQQQVESDLDQDPASAMLTELTLAQTLQQLGRYDSALHSAGRAIAAAQSTNDAAIEIDARLVQGTVLWNQGKYAEAEAALKQARELAERAGTAQQRGDIADRLGEVAFSRDRPDEARDWEQRALAELPADDAKSRAYALGDLASVDYTQGRIDSALEFNARSIDALRRLYPHGNSTLATQLSNRGAMLTRAHRYDEAQSALDESLAMKIALYGEKHRIVVEALTKLAQLHIEQDDAAGAVTYAERAYTLAEAMSTDNYVTARAAKKYAIALSLAHRDAESMSAARESVKIYKAHYADNYGELLDAQSVLGWVQARTGDIEAGRALAREAYARLLAEHGEKHNFTVEAKKRLDQIDRLAAGTGTSSHQSPPGDR